MSIARRVRQKLDRVARNALHGVLSTQLMRNKIDRYYIPLRESHGSTFVGLDDNDQAVVSALRRTGIYQTHLKELMLPESDRMLRAAGDIRQAIEARLVAGSAGPRDPYLIQAERRDLEDRPEIYLFGLNERLLKIVESYLGLPVAFGGFNFFHTLADGRERGARVWHLDGEDESIVKIAIYLNDVDLDGGPFEMIKDRVFKGGDPYKRPARHEKLERIVGKGISSKDIVTCVGPRGSVIFCDTARYYHRGRPATGHSRTAIFFNYYPRPPRRPYFCGKPIVGLEDFDLSRVTLSDYQRQSATWRTTLPALAKYVLPK